MVTEQPNELVSLSVADGVATITLNRPPMNALSTTVQAGFRAAADEVSERRDVRAVILYGGPKVFAAGADVKEMADWDHLTAIERTSTLTASFDAVAKIPKPVIAAVTGYALGGGLELALCADLRVVGDGKSYFGAAAFLGCRRFYICFSPKPELVAVVECE